MRVTTADDPPPHPAVARWMPVFFLIVSCLISISFLSVRNLYDDEIATTDLLPLPTHQIIATMNHTDVHPPGMYVLAHLGFKLIPSARWVTLFPLGCLYLGLAVFVLAYAPLFRTFRTRLLFLLFATLHPQLLMWGNSIRWYPWWTGLALIAVVIALNPRAPAGVLLRPARAVALGVLLACLFYLNYITILFSIAVMAGAMFRYGKQAWRTLLLTAVTTLALILPQLPAFLTVHLRGSGEQRANPLLSMARLAQSLLCSEAYLPWHPMAILSAVLFLTLAWIGSAALVRRLRSRKQHSLRSPAGSLESILVLSLIFLVLVGISGLGGKPRNGMALVPMLAPAVALAGGRLSKRRVQAGMLVIVAAWCALGTVHLLRREGLTKAGMNNRPEEVLRFIEASRGSGCSVAITYDPVLSFYLAQNQLPRQVLLTPSQNHLYREAAPLNPATCTTMDLYVVHSYLGGFGMYEAILPAQLHEATQFIHSQLKRSAFSYDPDARFKRRLKFISGTSALPDYRYSVESGRIAPADLESLEAHLPYFAVANGHSKPKLP